MDPGRSQPTPVRTGEGRDPIARVLAYHQRTKHHLQRTARAPGFLDWANQPDPFRTYPGAPAIDLPLQADGLATAYGDLYLPGAVAPRPLDREGIALLFELALGLSAWKQYRDQRWALRCNPSSGNLHPTEGYAILPGLPGLEAGVYHYDSHGHRLERRWTPTESDRLGAALPPRTFLVGLSTIAWREAWKYGERAFRYCQHDIGHALAALRYAAAALGWTAALLDHVADGDLAGWLGLDREEDFAEIDPADREQPAATILLGAVPPAPELDTLRLTTAVRAGTWSGRPNRLSAAHVAWPVIDDVAEATWKPAILPAERFDSPRLPPLSTRPGMPAAKVIRQRRSCLGLDGRTTIAAATFYTLLDHLLPRPGVPPWDLVTWTPLIHIAIFVHRVDGVTPGLYLFERHRGTHERLQAALDAGFAWTRPEGCPEHLPLFLLVSRDFRDVARVVSCHQEIAADGVLSLGMIAEFGAPIREQGAWWYRHLHWEAGLLGQALYLEAEAAGVRGTGIGCYFDDAFHDLLGLDGDRFQDLYHFTMGGAVDDPRLTTLPPYAHIGVSKLRQIDFL